jgi:hypothetical protein
MAACEWRRSSLVTAPIGDAKPTEEKLRHTKEKGVIVMKCSYSSHHELVNRMPQRSDTVKHQARILILWLETAH